MHAQTKQIIAISPASFTNGATATGQIDTLGYDYADIDLAMATSNDVTNNPSTLKLTEGDTTVISNSASISGCVGDTDFTIANAVTSGVWGAKFRVSLVGRKRYLYIHVTPVTTQIMSAIANLSRGEDAPVNTTLANVKNLVAV